MARKPKDGSETVAGILGPVLGISIVVGVVVFSGILERTPSAVQDEQDRFDYANSGVVETGPLPDRRQILPPETRTAPERQFGEYNVLSGFKQYGENDPFFRFFSREWDQDSVGGRIVLGSELFDLNLAAQMEIMALRLDVRDMAAWHIQRNEPDRGHPPDNVFITDERWKALHAWWQEYGRLAQKPMIWDEVVGPSPDRKRISFAAALGVYRQLVAKGERLNAEELSWMESMVRKVGEEGLGFVWNSQAMNADGTFGRFDFTKPVPPQSAFAQLRNLREMKDVMGQR